MSRPDPPASLLPTYLPIEGGVKPLKALGMRKMEVEGSNLDTISTLPHDLTTKILSLLPIKHALRTSILSKKWRYQWRGIPELSFHDKTFEGIKEIVKYKFVNAIYHVLMLHSGPLLVFTLFCEVDMASEMDNIIHYLSRMNTLKTFTFINKSANNYKLASSFFSLQGLEHIQLNNCQFDPPLTFNGFSRLRWLYIIDVKITPEMLKRALTNCPLLQDVNMFGVNKDITRGNKLTFVDLFECLPSIARFGLSLFYMQYFAAGGLPHKLPITILHLKRLFLSLCFSKQDEFLSILSLINGSPNLLRLCIVAAFPPSPMDVFDLQGYSSLKLDHLEMFGIVCFNNTAMEMEFVKLVMANAHVLQLLQLDVSAKVSDDEEARLRRDLIQLPFPRASPSLEIIIGRHLPEDWDSCIL